MKKFMILEREFKGGTQKIYKFENGYGASVVRHQYSFGYQDNLWEMALLTFGYSDGGELLWEIVYRDDFANGGVAGYLSDKEVMELLKWIKSYKAEE